MLGWTEGTYCGYQVARDTKFDVEKTMITYMTTGILLQKLINEKNLNTYTHIILDEVSDSVVTRAEISLWYSARFIYELD